MTRKQTSAKVSKLAARILRMTDEEIMDIEAGQFLKTVRTLAAFCLSPEEVHVDSPAQRRKKAEIAGIKSTFPELTDLDIKTLMRGEVVIKTDKTKP